MHSDIESFGTLSSNFIKTLASDAYMDGYARGAHLHNVTTMAMMLYHHFPFASKTEKRRSEIYLV